MSSQVGAGHVSIYPVMTGFRSKVASEMKSAGRDGARDFEGAMKGAGSTSGKKLGSDLKSAFDSSSKDLGSRGLQNLQREVAKASDSLSKARLKQQDEAGKVRVAEAKLQETIEKYGPTSSQAIAAEERLEAARRREGEATDRVKSASDRLKNAQENVAQVTEQSGDEAEKAQSKFAGFLESVKDKSVAAGSSLKDHLMGGLTTAADMLRGPATAAVAGAGAAIGFSLTKGFGRMTAIDSATKKLKGLGHDGAEASAIMNSASAAVKGTAYGLDEAATTAAGATAAGIKPGKQLEDTLKTVANTASATGRGMEEMGSIFNSVAGNQKASTNDIKALANAGLPMWQKLSEVTGKSIAEIQKDVTAGKIDFETFQKAAELAAGTVADEMGKTVPGALSNLRASLGRIGANLWGGIDDEGNVSGIYARLGPLLDSVKSALGPVEDLAGRLGKELDRTLGPALEKVTAFFNMLGEGGDTLKGKFSGVMSALAPLTGMFLTLGSAGLAGVLTKIPMVGGLFGGLAGKLKFLGGPLGLVIGLFGGLAMADPSKMLTGVDKVVGGLGDMLNTVVPKLVDKVTEIIPKMVTNLAANIPTLLNGALQLFNALLAAVMLIIPPLITMVAEIAPVIVAALVNMLPILLQGALDLFMGLVDAAVQIVPLLVHAVADMLPPILTAIVGMLPRLIQGAVQLFAGLIQALGQIVPMLVQTIADLVPMLVGIIVSLVPALLDGALELFMALVDAIPVILPMLLETVADMLPPMLDAILGMIPQMLDGAITLFTGIVDAIPRILPQLLNAIVGMLPQILTSVISMIPQLLTTAVQLFVSIVSAIPKMIPQLVAALPQIIRAITDTLMGTDWGSLGMDIIRGIIVGLGSMAGAIKDAMVEIAKSAFNGIKSFFGIKSPSRLMRDKIGKMLPRGIAVGVEEEADTAVDAAKALAQKVAGAASTAGEATLSAVGTISNGASSGASDSRTPETTVTQNFDVHTDNPALVAAIVAEKLRRAV